MELIVSVKVTQRHDVSDCIISPNVLKVSLGDTHIHSVGPCPAGNL